MQLTYQELIQELQSTKPNPRYYHTLIENSQTILLQIAIQSQRIVAEDLKMTTSKLSNIVCILKEYADDTQ